MRAPRNARGPGSWLMVIAFATMTSVTHACAQQPAGEPSGGAVGSAVAAYHAGRYDDAIAKLRALVDADATNGLARRALVRALAETGKYEEAESIGRAAPAGAEREALTALGEVLVERGRLAAAESAFVRARAAHASDSLRAAADLAQLHWRRGARAEALRLADAVVDAYGARRGRLTADELLAVAEACRLLGATNPQLFKDALRAYDEAAAAAPADPEPRARLGEMFLEKYNSPDAQRAFDDALKLNPRHPRALLGSALRRDFDGVPGADSLAARALAVNPQFVPALLRDASSQLVSDRVADAAATATRALQVDPMSPDALGALAAVRFVSGDAAGVAEAERRAREAGGLGAFLTSLAETASRVRRYAEAADFARRAIAADSLAWRAHALLGTNLLRLGAADSARVQLERAFAGDPYDVWTKNTLDLLDTYKDYDLVEAGRFRVLVEKKESALLPPYLQALGDEAWTRFAERYGWQPAGPVRVELYRSHEDFSVRSVGLTGLGALGVAFGDVLALDSPAARERGEFNWASTFWHELAHTFTLGASAGRVPRWLSEGLSVYEEWHARPGWGFDVSPTYLLAFRDGKLRPPSRLNEGFTRPKSPVEVMHSYVQAALVCEMLAQDHGPVVFRKLMEAYRRGRSTPEAFREATGRTVEQLDAHFDAWMRTRYATQLAALGADGKGELAEAITSGAALAKQGRDDEAIKQLERAKALYPEYVGPDDPRWHLAAIYKKRGDEKRAADELAGLVAQDERHLDAYLQLAALRESLGDRAAAAAALEGALHVWPYERTLHERLAALSEGTNAARVVRERRAVLALAPPDRAEAQYQLARALQAAGDAAGARREVLRALELAPNFEKAQELLLALRGKS